jgi:hypothetical protein
MRPKITQLILMLPFCAMSQQMDSCWAGVYNTKEDFVAGYLSHRVNTDRKGYKLGFAVPADLKLTIKLSTPDSVFKFKAGSVYGYNECGKIYRYYGGGELNAPEDFYKIEEAAGLVIYSSRFVGGTESFYSLDLNAPIHRLNMKNLERDFKQYPGFTDAVKKLEKQGGLGEIGNIAKRDEIGRFIINKLHKELVVQ